MTLAGDIAALSIAEIESRPKIEPPPENNDHTQEVFDSIIQYIKAECIGFGSVIVMLDTVKDRYSIIENERTNYSADKVISLLKKNGFRVEIVHDHSDAIDVRIIWHQGLPGKSQLKYTDKYKGVYSPSQD